jgi:hypothetical protein
LITCLKENPHYFDNDIHLHGPPSNKRRFDDDDGPSSTLPSTPLRRRVGDEVGAEVLLVAKAAIAPPMAEKVVSVPQDDSDDEGSDNDSEVSSHDDLGRDDVEGSGNDNGEDIALLIPFRMTPTGVMWFKCPVCLGEEYDSKAKVVLHAVNVIKEDAGSLNVVERHLQILRAR